MLDRPCMVYPNNVGVVPVIPSVHLDVPSIGLFMFV